MDELYVATEPETVPDYLLDDNGKKRRFEPCIVDQATFKRRLIERKINDAAPKT